MTAIHSTLAPVAHGGAAGAVGELLLTLAAAAALAVLWVRSRRPAEDEGDGDSEAAHGARPDARER